jgi:hypothetical protein
MGNDECDELLEALGTIGRKFNGYEYGLPMHDADEVERMREAVREWFGTRL